MLIHDIQYKKILYYTFAILSTVPIGSANAILIQSEGKVKGDPRDPYASVFSVYSRIFGKLPDSRNQRDNKGIVDPRSSVTASGCHRAPLEISF